MMGRAGNTCRTAGSTTLIGWPWGWTGGCGVWAVLASFQDAASVILLEGTVRDTAAGLGRAWTGKTLVEARQGLRGGDEPGVLVSAVARGRGVRRLRVTGTSWVGGAANGPVRQTALVD